jgi:hypothetical protein
MHVTAHHGVKPDAAVVPMHVADDVGARVNVGGGIDRRHDPAEPDQHAPTIASPAAAAQPRDLQSMVDVQPITQDVVVRLW